MEPTVRRVVVFGGAAVAHVEVGHGRRRAVIGQSTDDGEARATICAGDEGCRYRRFAGSNNSVTHSSQTAMSAGIGVVRRRPRGWLRYESRCDAGSCSAGDFATGNVGDDRKRRCFGDEHFPNCSMAAGAPWVSMNTAAELLPTSNSAVRWPIGGQKRAKTHALHNASHREPVALNGLCAWGRERGNHGRRQIMTAIVAESATASRFFV